MHAAHALRRRLAEALCAHVHEMAQVDAAHELRIDQSDVSRLRNGAIARYSTERLLSILSRVGYDVEIRISKARRPKPERISPRMRVISIDPFGRESELEGRAAPRGRYTSFYAEEMASDE